MIEHGATLGPAGFAAIILAWCGFMWGWWRVAIVALCGSVFGIFLTLYTQGFSILAAFGGLVDRAMAAGVIVGVL